MVTAVITGILCFVIGFAISYLLWREALEKQRKTIRRLKAGIEEPKKKKETTKCVIWICLVMGFAWVWCSYVLAYLDHPQIAESLSQVAVTEIIGVVLAYCIKSAVENLSKNNRWPDRDPPPESGDDESGEG